MNNVIKKARKVLVTTGCLIVMANPTPLNIN